MDLEKIARHFEKEYFPFLNIEERGNTSVSIIGDLRTLLRQTKCVPTLSKFPKLKSHFVMLYEVANS